MCKSLVLGYLRFRFEPLHTIETKEEILVHPFGFLFGYSSCSVVEFRLYTSLRRNQR